MVENVGKFVELHTQCYNLPKIDIHAHLNGSIRISTLLSLLSPGDQEKFTTLGIASNYAKAFEMFKIASKILKDLSVISRITREMIEDWNKQNCVYLEIRTTLKTIANTTKADYLKTVLQEIEEGNKKYKMQTRLIICLNRESPIEDAHDSYNTFMNFESELKRLIVGVDYSGYEANEKIPHEQIFEVLGKFRSAGLKVTYHIGEVAEYKMIDFNVFRPDRISHTYHFNQEDVQKIRDAKIPVEVCPTSTLFIFNKTSYDEIHFKQYYEKERKENLVCLNTDDTMILSTNISQEYFEIAMAHNLEKEDLVNIIENTINFIFETDESVREDLRNQIKRFSN